MRIFILFCTCLLVLLFETRCASIQELQTLVKPRPDYAGCINFSPYVSPYDPSSLHPPASLIDTLLDRIVEDTPFRCIVSYGVLNGLNYTFQAAKNRGISVIAVLWLDGNIPEENQQSIEQGIYNIQLYTSVIKAVACGVELRVRNSQEVAEDLITDCVTKLRQANINKPIGVTDVWWSFVNQKWPYTQWTVAAQLDWIGVNIYPWWETKFDRNCISHLTAPKFHIETLYTIQKLYPNTFVMLSEYGWPGGAQSSEQAILKDKNTGEACALASEDTQNYALNTTIQLLAKYDMAGIVFASFREGWKDVKEPGGIASYWGICQGEAPYRCKNVWPSTFETEVYVEALGPRPTPKSSGILPFPKRSSVPISPERSQVMNNASVEILSRTFIVSLLLFTIFVLV